MNKFEETLNRLNKEREAKVAEIQERIDRLMAQNANMNQLRQLNQEHIKMLDREKAQVSKHYRHLKAEVMQEMEGYYGEPMNHAGYKRWAAFLAANADVQERWNQWKAERREAEALAGETPANREGGAL